MSEEPPVADAIENDYPLLWAASRNADHREAAGWSVGQGDAEAAKAMCEIREMRAFCDWLLAMDDPEDVMGREERRTVTLTEIINRAAALRSDAG